MSSTSINNFEGLPLFQAVASRTCDKCFGTSLILKSDNSIDCCDQLQFRTHPLLNNESFRLIKAVESLTDRKFWIDPKAFDLARLLTNFTSENPCPRQEIFDTFYESATKNTLRKFHALVEELRSVWLLPIGSRKNEPSGYWIITDLTDFKDWIDRVKAAPITQLSTIHKVARANFPIFAEQMELEFWTDIKAEEKQNGND